MRSFRSCISFLWSINWRWCYCWSNRDSDNKLINCFYLIFLQRRSSLWFTGYKECFDFNESDKNVRRQTLREEEDSWASLCLNWVKVSALKWPRVFFFFFSFPSSSRSTLFISPFHRKETLTKSLRCKTTNFWYRFISRFIVHLALFFPLFSSISVPFFSLNLLFFCIKLNVFFWFLFRVSFQIWNISVHWVRAAKNYKLSHCSSLSVASTYN